MHKQIKVYLLKTAIGREAEQELLPPPKPDRREAELLLMHIPGR